MDLYFIRHGIAIDREDPKSPPEAERFLTHDGLLKTRTAAKGFASLEPKVKLVLSSPWMRARQTAEIFMEELKVDVGKLVFSDALLWDVNPVLLMEELSLRRTLTAIMCVGHAPHIDHFIAYCIGTKSPITALKKASLIHLSIDTFDFGGASLEGLYPPKILRALR